MNRRKKAGGRIICILFAAVFLTAAAGLTGCGKRYIVDYCGQKDEYANAKDSYRQGERVSLYYQLMATDTDYAFYLDGEEIDFEYVEGKGFLIEFPMPGHNVTLECRTFATMMPDIDDYPGDPEPEEDLDASDGWFTWDLNGDGVPEKFSLDHIANGDEATDVGIITRSEDGAKAYIDRFYGIESITAGEDEDGRYLEITFYEGDY